MTLYSFFIFSLMISCAIHKNDITATAAQVRFLTKDESQKLLTPTIYYIPQYFKTDHESCFGNEKIDLITADNAFIVRTCRKVYKSCEMQGTCKIEISKNKFILLSADKRNEDGVRTFHRMKSLTCIHGLGAAKDRKSGYKQMCTDPFYSVAADLSLYNLGDVIYIPVLKGLVLPSGELHNGYVIVRDSGSLIRGVGRFDFFTGYFGLSRSNPFYKLGLGGDNIFPEYYVIRGPEADRIRAWRRFPYLNTESYSKTNSIISQR